MPRILTSLSKRLTRLRRFPVLVRRRSAVFLLDPSNWVDNRIIAAAPFEEEQITAAANVIASRQLDLVIDIGANFGLYTILLGRLPQVREVIAFEPVRRNYAQLLGNVFANRLESKVEAHRLGLAKSEAGATIHVDPRSTGVSRLNLATAERDASVFTEQESIRLARFDKVCPLSGRRAFVKIDVEGEADGVLDGMAHFLQANEAVLQIELSGAEDQPVRERLTRAGYKEIARYGADVIFARPA